MPNVKNRVKKQPNLNNHVPNINDRIPNLNDRVSNLNDLLPKNLEKHCLDYMPNLNNDVQFFFKKIQMIKSKKNSQI